MMNKWRKPIAFLLALFAVVVMLSDQVKADSYAPISGRLDEIEDYIRSEKEKMGVPGLAVVIVEGNKTVLSKGYGWADREEKRPVTPQTLFEIGSTSKAYTALAVLRLEKEGRLDLDAYLSRYVPGLHFTYKGKEAEVTLRQLLHHTSGVPFRTIGTIPQADDEGALERTVRMLNGLKLDRKPGEKYDYATINYDILAFVVQQITGLPFEKYMREQILDPLGLTGTYMYQAPEGAEMAQGYRPGLLRTWAYDAPAFRGNTAAGYVISSASEMEKWLKIQLGVVPGLGLDPEIVRKSHEPDQTVPPNPDGSSYAAGWGLYYKGTGELAHEGSNPNFSSFLILRPQDGIGVAILANESDMRTMTLGQGIMSMIMDKKMPDPLKDMWKGLDATASAGLFISAPVVILTMWQLITAIVQLARRQRKFRAGAAQVLGVSASLVIGVAVLGYCLYQIPDALFGGLNWQFAAVWAPFTVPAAAWAIFIAATLFGIYYALTALAPKPGDKSMLPLVVLSLASGFGNALIIFIVNAALGHIDDEKFPSGLLLYLFAGIFLYVVGQKLVRTRLIRIANDMVYGKRVELTQLVLKAPFRRLERLEQGKIQAALNNDTEVISEFSNIVVTGATSLVTLICCFVYMGTISGYGLLVSLFVIVTAAGLHFLFGRQAQRIWEQTRDIQNVFFGFIHHMTSGFKELALHEGRREGFQSDMIASSQTYRDKRIRGDMKFANVNVIGELLFSVVVGVVAFLFPVLFPAMKASSIQTYVFVLLYMTGPIHGILGSIPNMIRVRISWGRINALAAELSEEQAGSESLAAAVPLPAGVPFRSLELDHVVYRHPSREDGATFEVGPINLAFRAGEVTFITGGNGSGKSTLARLTTGLYAADDGEIRVNGMAQEPEWLGQQFSAIFSDYHLFEKLYGVDVAAKGDEIERHMSQLRLHGKVRIGDSRMDTLALSTGQRKRLALLISYLEDRPIYLFDEWAADQDPEFRQFFYEALLPELKERGKCIIAITHDDRYFGLADKIVKLELGQVVGIEDGNRLAQTANAAG
ncbi:cyclic peptide transporter [Paenibacillus curdlanolyticus YK9]|uniref:Cyclic peptide transporter n=1 Tax=Paenibacillus curdlanolyticus YK9 TaxID=717606 RepID=E0IG99_9BACL|nr:cyclic peptide export ABC transporter [Paenibacillus curdlanolyticus]EFM08501.1 cyclic peptide transporter [Paenibacillus curdlanolyticus YK9]